MQIKIKELLLFILSFFFEILFHNKELLVLFIFFNLNNETNLRIAFIKEREREREIGFYYIYMLVSLVYYIEKRRK